MPQQKYTPKILKSILRLSAENPEQAKRKLYALLKGRRNTLSGRKILASIKQIQQNEKQQRERMYKRFAAQNGINIPEQSQQNIQRLREQVAGYYSLEQLDDLKKHWYQHVVPLFVLKHITHDIRDIQRDGFLASVKYRLAKKEQITNNHTRGASSRQEFIYFVLGFVGHQLEYWDVDEKPHTIIVEIGKAFCAGQRDLCRGVWIGSHISPQVSTGHLPSHYLGSTLRSVTYTHASRECSTKQTHYQYADNSEQIREIKRDEEIFSAEAGWQTIFDALFYQVIIEIHFAGVELKQALLQSAEPEKVLRLTFKNLYIPDVYPEAKLAQGMLNLNSSYIKIVSKQFIGQEITELFQRAKAGDAKFVQDFLKSKPHYLELKLNDKTLLKAVVQSLENAFRLVPGLEEKRLQTINVLIELGANFNNCAMISDFISDLIHPRTLPIFERLVQGIPEPEFPLIKRTFNRQRSVGQKKSILAVALQKGSFELFESLLLQGAKITDHISILLAYCDGKHSVDKLLMFITDYQLNINAVDDAGNNLFMLLASKDAIEYLRILHDAYPDKLEINHLNHAGKNALYLAVEEGKSNSVKFLFEIGVDPLVIDHSGESAYSKAYKLSHETPWQMPLPDKTKIECVADAVKFAQQNRNKKHKDSYKKILAVFSKNEAELIPAPKTLVQSARYQRKTVAALVLNSEQKVLMVRKKASSGQPSGHFMFPGGFQDATDPDAISACARECMEETGIKITPQSFHQFIWYDGLTSTLHSCEFGIAVTETDLEPEAMDDVAEAVWIDWSKVSRTEFGGYLYEGVTITFSNAQLISAYFDNNLAAQKTAIDDCLQFNIAAPTILPELFKQDIDLFVTTVKKHDIDISQYSYIALAALLNRYEKIPLLMEIGADINTIYSFYHHETGRTLQCTALTYMVELGELAKAKQLIAWGADVNTVITDKFSGHQFTLLGFICSLPESDALMAFMETLIREYSVKLSEGIATKAVVYALFEHNYRMVDVLFNLDKGCHLNINELFLHGSQKINIVTAAIHAGAIDFLYRIKAMNITPELAADDDVCNFIEYELYLYHQSIALKHNLNTPFNNPGVIPQYVETRAVLYSLWPHLRPQSLDIYNAVAFYTMPSKRRFVFQSSSANEDEILLLYLPSAEQWQLPNMSTVDKLEHTPVYYFKLSEREAKSEIRYHLAKLSSEQKSKVNKQVQTAYPKAELKWLSLSDAKAVLNKAEKYLLEHLEVGDLPPRFDKTLDRMILDVEFQPKNFESSEEDKCFNNFFSSIGI